ncbi:galactose-specific lectin nattectin-like [Sander vitreus]
MVDPAMVLGGEPCCPPGWTQFGTRCFSFYIQTKTWSDAETFCQTAGGNLASIQSAEEHAFLRDYINQVTGIDKNAWIGGTDAVQEGTWLWTDGSKFDYKSFAAGQPDNAGGVENCLEMNWGGNGWNNGVCTFRCHSCAPRPACNYRAIMMPLRSFIPKTDVFFIHLISFII